MLLNSSQVGALASRRAPTRGSRTEERDSVMAELKVYEVEINGHKATLQLSAEDAQRIGAGDPIPGVGEVKSRPVANKARRAGNKGL